MDSAPPPVQEEEVVTATAPPAAEVEQIKLRVCSQEGQEMFFKIRKDTLLKRLMDTYCSRVGGSSLTVRFLFDGARINDKDTPDSLKMEEGDTIDAVAEQTGGF